ncbi:MAG TPA: TolC family outer membrane protein, partial [Hyphomicrobiaceae bacterium]|nr:TolC family outer membrane protein [Hyphomicrobiaceae bacterium]
MKLNHDSCVKRRATRLLRTLASSVPIWAYCISAPAVAETLSQALNATYKTNPRLDAERARLRATDEEVSRANAGYLPTILGSADVSYQNRETKPVSTTDGEAHPKGYAVNLTQPVFQGFRTLNSVREAEATVRAGRETLRGVEQLVLLDAVTAYMNVLRDQAIVGLRENNVEVLSRELQATQDRFAVGEVTRTDVAQAQARRALAVSQLDGARADLKRSRADYERVVGHPPSQLSEPGVPERLVPKSLDEALAISAREDPAIIAALYREQAARHTVDRIRGELLPEFAVQANYSKRFDPSTTTDELEATEVTGRLTVPIYGGVLGGSGGEVQARVRQAKQVHISRLQEIEEFRTEAQNGANGVVSFWSQLQAARARLQSDMVQVEANRTALAGVREEERVGQRTLLDVLNAQQELLNSEVAIERTRRDLIVN